MGELTVYVNGVDVEEAIILKVVTKFRWNSSVFVYIQGVQ